MKRPFAQGDVFAVPLGNGETTTGTVRRIEPHRAFVSVFDPTGTSVWEGWASDRAFLHHRWRRSGRETDPPAHLIARSPRVANARIERDVARALGLPCVSDSMQLVQDVHTILAGAALSERVSTLGLRSPASDRGALAGVIRARPDLVVHVHGTASLSLETLAEFGIRHLVLDRWPEGTSSVPSVETLGLRDGPALETVARAFPNLRALRIAGSAMPVVLVHASLWPHLRSLEVSRGVVQSIESLTALPQLRALRLYRCRGVTSVAWLPATRLEILALEDLPELVSIAPLAQTRSLQQVELRGLWQFDVADAQPLLDLPSLVRCTVDIGGRRKNIEIYRQARWAYPWPFPEIARSLAKTPLSP